MKLFNYIGSTPVVKIERLNPNPLVNIYAKLEGFNPAGSVKDRIALYMIEGAEKEGLLTKEKIIIEATSGNTGIGLAMVAKIKGYKIQLVMPESMSMERRKILKAYGAEILLTAADTGMNGAIEKADELGKDKDKYFQPDQFGNFHNVRAHYETTGKEILEQVGKVDVFVAGIGTGGTVTGAGRRIREKYDDVKIIGVEPNQGSKIQGLRNLNDYMPTIIDLGIMDERIIAEDDDAFQMTRRLARDEGLFVGISSGAAMDIALKKAKEMDKGNIVVILPDSGDKYLTTGLFD
ncbi:MAG: cysteine synthase family protein [Actinomycetia bacterium]|nr:cysteine synthase family protein [Actinomycetes bacterium]